MAIICDQGYWRNSGNQKLKEIKSQAKRRINDSHKKIESFKMHLDKVAIDKECVTPLFKYIPLLAIWIKKRRVNFNFCLIQHNL